MSSLTIAEAKAELEALGSWNSLKGEDRKRYKFLKDYIEDGEQVEVTPQVPSVRVPTDKPRQFSGEFKLKDWVQRKIQGDKFQIVAINEKGELGRVVNRRDPMVWVRPHDVVPFE